MATKAGKTSYTEFQVITDSGCDCNFLTFTNPDPEDLNTQPIYSPESSSTTETSSVTPVCYDTDGAVTDSSAASPVKNMRRLIAVKTAPELVRRCYEDLDLKCDDPDDSVNYYGTF